MIADRITLAEHLSGMVKFPTVSTEEERDMDFSVFLQFQEYLKTTYPLINQTFQREVIGPAALLYRWESPCSSGKRPLLLAAHQDVVPPGDPVNWAYPPFDGVIDGEFVWGRGSLDCKNSIMGQMEALESLIQEGFQPDFDIYLAYSYNEEVSTTCKTPAAAKIVQTLKERGVRLGVVLDEGGCVVPGTSVDTDMGGLVANVGLAEKGYADLLLYKTGKAGHAARPGRPNIMADVARAVVLLDEHPFPYRILPEIALQYRLLAPYVKEHREIYQDIRQHQEVLFALLDQAPDAAAKFRTSVAMTMAEGSYRPNVMPSKVSVHLNCRPLPGDTIENVLERFQELLSQENGVQVELLGGRNPSPMSSADTPEFAHLQAVIEDLYPGITVLPSICLGGTDAYFYYPIADHVFRFSGENRVAKNGPAHGVNERISLDTIDAIPNFIEHYIRGY